MQRFVELFLALDRSNKSKDKTEALTAFFLESPAADAAWGLYFLSGKKLPAIAKSSQLRAWAADISGLPSWLIERCYETAGDLAETLALLLPTNELDSATDDSLTTVVENLLMPLAARDDASRRQAIVSFWQTHDSDARFVFNKLMTGGLRVGVSRTTVEKAVAQALDLEPTQVAHRLMGHWEPTEAFWHGLASEDASNDPARPYPFYLASPIEERSVPRDGQQEMDWSDRLRDLGSIEDWALEWKWDGIRAQLIRRHDTIILWSRGEEMINDSFPEIIEAAHSLPEGTVIDGEILVWSQKGLHPFADLQKRIGRKQISDAIRTKLPTCFLAYDLLEHSGEDVRIQPHTERHALLETLLNTWEPPRDVGGAGEQWDFFESISDSMSEICPALRLSNPVGVTSWDAAQELQAQSREFGVEGFILKRKDAPYKQGRIRGDWWKWKIDPYTIDCVMLNAQAGHGRRAGLYTDFTFGVWHGDEIVPITKAYSGLTDKEFRAVDTWIKSHTTARRGPIRMVEPELVFEIAFEGLQRSSRHKSGIAFRFPRIARWRTDKTPQDATTLEEVERLLEGTEVVRQMN